MQLSRSTTPSNLKSVKKPQKASCEEYLAHWQASLDGFKRVGKGAEQCQGSECGVCRVSIRTEVSNLGTDQSFML